MDLIEQIQVIDPAAGARRIRAALKDDYKLVVNRKKIRRLMLQNGLKAMIWSGFKVKTTDPNHSFRIAPNRIAGTEVTAVNQVWVADITYIRVKYGFVYLAAIMDLYSRLIVGWAISKRIDATLCRTALLAAISLRNPSPGLIHHSDRGIQYACDDYRATLEAHGMIQSMSAKGHCYDNAFMESFFKTLKTEEVYLTEYESSEDVEKNIPRFIDDVYNVKRRHSSLGYKSPAEYERLVLQGKTILANLGVPTVVNVWS